LGEKTFLQAAHYYMEKRLDPGGTTRLFTMNHPQSSRPDNCPKQRSKASPYCAASVTCHFLEALMKIREKTLFTASMTGIYRIGCTAMTSWIMSGK
jgi:hypothetical protein